MYEPLLRLFRLRWSHLKEGWGDHLVVKYNNLGKWDDGYNYIARRVNTDLCNVSGPGTSVRWLFTVPLDLL